MRPTVFAGLFPVDPDKYLNLKCALEKLCLNDTSVTLAPEMSVVLGQGWRIGFLGALHVEVFGQRLGIFNFLSVKTKYYFFQGHEYREEVILTNPTIEYKADIVDNESVRKRRHNGRSQILITTPETFPAIVTDVKRYKNNYATG
jgi:GTP-binding protein LepA